MAAEMLSKFLKSLAKPWSEDFFFPEQILMHTVFCSTSTACLKSLTSWSMFISISAVPLLFSYHAMFIAVYNSQFCSHGIWFILMLCNDCVLYNYPYYHVYLLYCAARHSIETVLLLSCGTVLFTCIVIQNSECKKRGFTSYSIAQWLVIHLSIQRFRVQTLLLPACVLLQYLNLNFGLPSDTTEMFALLS